MACPAIREKQRGRLRLTSVFGATRCDLCLLTPRPSVRGVGAEFLCSTALSPSIWRTISATHIFD